MPPDKLNQRIAAKLKEMGSDREDRQRARRLVHRLDLRTDEVKAELAAVRERLRKRREVLKDVRADLAQANAETPEEDTPGEQELAALLDQLAGEHEQDIAIRGRLLLRLDDLQEREDDARQVLEKVVAESAEDREALQRMRERRRRAREARARNDRPSPNFDWAEFDCNDGTPHPEESKPAIRHWCVTVGEPARAKYGSVNVNSGHRHRAYNASVGGEPNSVHIYDFPGRDHKAVAVDFTCERGTPSEWYAFTAGKADGRGLYNSFHHADTRNHIGWPDATWSG